MLTEMCPCGVRFAIGLLACPRCKHIAPRFAGRVKEDHMPRITVAAGPTNAAALPGEVGYMEPAKATGGHTDVAAPAPEAPAVPAATEGADPPTPGPVPGSAPDYSSMTQAALREEARGRGLPVGGSKADLAGRLAGHDAATQTPTTEEEA